MRREENSEILLRFSFIISPSAPSDPPKERKMRSIDLIIAQIVHLFEKNGMNLPYEYPIEGFEKQHLGKSQN